jgi:hypothetical protein
MGAEALATELGWITNSRYNRVVARDFTFIIVILDIH